MVLSFFTIDLHNNRNGAALSFAWRILLQTLFNGTALIDAKLRKRFTVALFCRQREDKKMNCSVQQTVQEILQPAWLLWLGLLTPKASRLWHMRSIALPERGPRPRLQNSSTCIETCTLGATSSRCQRAFCIQRREICLFDTDERFKKWGEGLKIQFFNTILFVCGFLFLGFFTKPGFSLTLFFKLLGSSGTVVIRRIWLQEQSTPCKSLKPPNHRPN